MESGPQSPQIEKAHKQQRRPSTTENKKNKSSKKSLQITNAGEGVEKRLPSYTVGGNVSWCSHLWQTVWKCLKNLELSYDSTILLLGIHLDTTTIQKDTCTPMFIVALFTIAKTWKQPKCSTDEWIKEMRYIYMMEYDSAIKKNKIMTFAQPSRTLWGLSQINYPHSHVLSLLLSAKKTSKNKFNQSETIQKERKTMKQDKIIIV